MAAPAARISHRLEWFSSVMAAPPFRAECPVGRVWAARPPVIRRGRETGKDGPKARKNNKKPPPAAGGGSKQKSNREADAQCSDYAAPDSLDEADSPTELRSASLGS